MRAVRALLASPPLALAAFALSTAALLVERLALGLARGESAEAVIAPLLFWLALASAFGAFWLGSALRLAGLLASPPTRLASAGGLATAALGAFVAPIDLGGPAGDALGLGLSAACFATFFLLRVGPHGA
jgi:hypothetical protein